MAPVSFLPKKKVGWHQPPKKTHLTKKMQELATNLAKSKAAKGAVDADVSFDSAAYKSLKKYWTDQQKKSNLEKAKAEKAEKANKWKSWYTESYNTKNFDKDEWTKEEWTAVWELDKVVKKHTFPGKEILEIVHGHGPHEPPRQVKLDKVKPKAKVEYLF